ncbi:MAG: 2-oxoglutarate dehydrogenase E1 subunit family protein, partial [Burkholderiales bacterium]
MMKEFLASSTLFGGNAPFVEQLYEQWLEDPQGVPAQWREYFERLQRVPAAGGAARDVAHAPIVAAFA